MCWRRFVWGRGAIDVKFGVTALLEAVSQLLARGRAPSYHALPSHLTGVRHCQRPLSICCKCPSMPDHTLPGAMHTPEGACKRKSGRSSRLHPLHIGNHTTVC